jgi:hypothetical protein
MAAVLTDENFPRPIVEVLRKQDRALLERAEADGRFLTLDKDFWQLALQRPIPLQRCGVILFRVFPSIPENLEPLVDRTLLVEHPWAGTSASSPRMASR